jgi:hypothetical protein
MVKCRDNWARRLVVGRQTVDLETGVQFSSGPPLYRGVVQLVERQIVNLEATGSSPVIPANLKGFLKEVLIALRSA